MKSGFVLIVGRPNAGKSTLLNALLKDKISIVSEKAQTTRNAIVGIYGDDDSQIIFTDTPGIHKATSTLGTFMNKEALSQVADVDLVYYLFDASKGFRQEDEEIVEGLFKDNKNIFLVLTKIDLVSKEELLKLTIFLSNKYKFKEIIPISAVKNNNLEELLKITKDYLEDGPYYFDPEGDITTITENFRISEIIREKILNVFYQEVPHMVAVYVEEKRHTEKRCFIKAVIVVGRESHKSIIIGKGGSSLKRINMNSCRDISEMMGKKAFLELFVKVDKDWINREHKLAEYGYSLNLRDEW